MQKVVIFGTGRGADVAFRFLRSTGRYEISGFTADSAFLSTDTFRGLPVKPFEEVEAHFPPDSFQLFALLGYQEMNGLRARKYEEGKRKGYTFASYVSPDIHRIEDIQVGENCFILDNQSINLDVRIGNNVVFWSSNHVGDLTVIEDHVWVSSHATIAANVVVGAASFIGIGATVSNHVRVGARTFVGANALVTSDTAENSVHVAGESKAVPVESGVFMKVMEAGGKV